MNKKKKKKKKNHKYRELTKNQLEKGYTYFFVFLTFCALSRRSQGHSPDGQTKMGRVPLRD
jgi:hypothetical protein